MGNSDKLHAAFKRAAADQAREHGNYLPAQRVFIVSEHITNDEGFSGDALVEYGSTVIDRLGCTATFLRAEDTSYVVVKNYENSPLLVSYVRAEMFNLKVTEH